MADSFKETKKGTKRGILKKEGPELQQLIEFYEEKKRFKLTNKITCLKGKDANVTKRIKEEQKKFEKKFGDQGNINEELYDDE